MMKGERAIALVLVIAFVMIVAMAAAAFILQSRHEMYMAARGNDHERALYIAEAGIQRAVYMVERFYEENGSVSDAQIEAVGGIENALDFAGFDFDIYTVSVGELYSGPAEGEPYYGLAAQIKPITITAEVSSASSGAGREVRVRLTQQMQVVFVPLFQFAVFYEEDLEILPLDNMYLTGMDVTGRIHTNGDLYLGSPTAQLCIDGFTTASGSIYHGRKDDPEAALNGPVKIKDDLGVYQNMKQGNDWLDSRHPDWASESQSLWGGRVQDQHHDLGAFEVSGPLHGNPRRMIERASGGDSSEIAATKYHNVAGLKIVNGVAEDSAGNPVTLPEGVLTTKSMYDAREGITMTVTEINVGIMTIMDAAPANRVIYVSNTGTDKAVRLVNGIDLPSGGLTLASDNMVYVQGDYNTNEKKPAAIVSDAVTVLSNNWDDANSTLALSQRKANATTVNAGILTGNTYTSEGSYNGGLENLMRFIESWNGKELNYNGSLSCLWASQNATGQWAEGQYTRPKRNYYYDYMFDNLNSIPSGIPTLSTVVKTSWQQE